MARMQVSRESLIEAFVRGASYICIKYECLRGK
jgi:hypothetical protein